MKKKGFKNYLILFIIVAVTIVLFLYIFSWYRQYKDSALTNPVISGTLREITYDDISAVTKERDFLFIYTCTSKEEKCRVFEEKFSNYIKSKDLSDYIVYIKLGYTSDEKDTLKRIYDNYKDSDLVKKVNNYPTIFVFNNGKIVDLLSFSDKNAPSMKKVKDFFLGYDFE